MQALVSDLIGEINMVRVRVMDLYGGNLDHPALDKLEDAINQLVEIEAERGH